MEKGVPRSNWSTQRGTKPPGCVAEALNGPALMSEKDKGGSLEKDILMEMTKCVNVT